MRKKIYDIQLIYINGKPVLQSVTNGRTYRMEFNPFANKNQQCQRFVDNIADAEEQILIKDSKDFTDYMFKKLIGE